MGIKSAKLAATYSDTGVKGADTTVVLTFADDSTYLVPLSSSNNYYQEYLEWVAAGNTPEAAD